MPSFTLRSFAGGELSPGLYPRTDLVKYATGLRTGRNGYVLRYGGFTNRPGSVFVGEVEDSSAVVKLIPFIESDTSNYMLEFGDQIMRVIKDGAYVTESSQAITAITNANPCVVTYSGSDTYANGDVIYISGIVGAIGTFLNGRTFKVANVNIGANTFELDYMDGSNVNSTSFGSYTSGGTIEEIFSIATPFTAAQLSRVQYSQNLNQMTLVHPSHDTQLLEKSSSSDTAWTIADEDFSIGYVSPGTSLSISSSGTTIFYILTRTDVAFRREEGNSLTYTLGTSTTPSSGSPVTITFTNNGPNSLALNYYRIYRSDSGERGTYGFIGTWAAKANNGGGTSTFVDRGIPPDFSVGPPTDGQQAVNNQTTVAYLQSRRVFGANQTVRMSGIGDYGHMVFDQEPITDASPIEFDLAGNQVSEIRHIIDLGAPVVFTNNAEYALQGNNGIVLPGEINPKRYSRFGSSYLAPLIVGSTALFVQARGNIIRDLGFDYQIDGYQGNDLTLFSSHLFDGFEIVDWAYQTVPHSIVWAVRDDGVLLSLTYIKEQQIFAWCKHDLGGDAIVENVAVIPGTTEDIVYLVVKRIVDGRSVRYVEYLSTRAITDIKDMIFMDSCLTYDGRHTGSTTMTISGGTNWDEDETLTLTASASTFASSWVGDEIHVTSGTDTIRLAIEAYTSATVVTVRPNRTVPVAMRSTALTTWGRAVDSVSGLWHIEGFDVSVLGDGFVAASPNNDAYTTVTVSNGQITLDQCYQVINVGLPYLTDMETLDIDIADGATLADKKKNVTQVTLHLEETRGLFVGGFEPEDEATDPLDGLMEMKIRDEEGYDEPVDLLTGVTDVVIDSAWDNGGHVFIRQVDPVPMTVLAITPSGWIPIGG